MTWQKVWHPGLRLRIIAPAVLVAIPALTLLIANNFDRRARAEAQIVQNAQQLARLAVVNQERLIEGTRQLLIAMSQSRDIREGNMAGCAAYLSQLIGQYNSTYNNIGFATPDGDVLCSGFGRPVSIRDRVYFRKAVQSQGFSVGDFNIGRQTGRPSLSFGYPVTNPQGTFIGVVFAALDLQRLNESLTDSDWPGDAVLTVTDRDDTIIAMHPDWQRWVGQSLAHDPVRKFIGDRPRGIINFSERRGEPELFAFDRVEKPADAGLTVRILMSKTQAMAPVNRAAYEGLAGIGLVALLVTAGVKAASDKLMLQPIAQLTRASRRLAAGDLGARGAAVTTIPELDELAKDFDAMAAAIEEREAARLRAEMERKALEHQYHQAQKMDAVGRLAGGIAHDFNNMLTAIIGYCELLLEDGKITETQRADVREIEKAGRTAAALTKQLLAFSRREIIEPLVVNLNDILGGMDKMLHRLLGEHIEVESHLAADLHSIKADRGQIEQVVLNLLVNARDAMPDGGHVLIETQNITLADGVASTFLAAPPGTYVMLSVTDQGSGIPADVLPHLFEPFFTTKGTGKGTGLGLATVYGIVKQNNGGICVQSRPGEGSAFRIYFPRTMEQPADAPSAAGGSREAQAKATVLVVEDDPGIRDLSMKILKRYGYRVLVAESGDEALRICRNHDGPIDLLLSDVVMPGMSGPQVAEAVTALRPSIKVLYMSGYTDDTIVRIGVMAHDMSFLQKPFTPERLANKILEVLNG